MKSTPRCLCGDSGRCVHSTCVQAGVMCSSCLPLRRGHCSNLFPAIDCPSTVAAGVGDQTSSQDDNSLTDADANNSVPVSNKRFQHAFGASLLPEGNCYDDSCGCG